MNSLHTSSVRIPVALNQGGQPPAIEIPFTSDLPSGTLVRVATPAMVLSDLVAGELTLPDGSVCEEILRYSREAQELEWVRHPQQAGLLVVRLPKDIHAGETAVFTSRFGEVDHRSPSFTQDQMYKPCRPYFSDMSWELYLEATESLEVDAPRHRVSPMIRMEFLPGEAVRLEAIWKADGALQLRHVDAYGNPAPTPETAEILHPSGEGGASVILPQTTSSPEWTDLHSVPLGTRLSVKRSSGDPVVSNPVPRTAAGQRVCFGEIHWHTELSSDGKRTLKDALHSAKHELCMDFAGPGDHIWLGGIFGENATPQMQAQELKDADDPGHFAVIPGAELSCRVGHANFYCDSIERYLEVCSNLPKARTPSEEEDITRYGWHLLTESMIPGHTALIPHHTNTNSYDKEKVVNPENGRPFWSAMTFPCGEEMPHVRCMEIYQSRGSFEAEELDAHWRIECGGYGASARSALMKGYRIGFTGGTDNHMGWPSRNHHGGKVDGLTAVICEHVDTASIWQAMYDRHCYATTGARILCDVTLNGQPIGSELKLAWDASREINIRIHGTAPLECVEVISAGVVLDSLPIEPGSLDLVTTWEDLRPGRPLHDVYYYLRIRQVDGNIAWLSPFWIDAV